MHTCYNMLIPMISLLVPLLNVGAFYTGTGLLCLACKIDESFLTYPNTMYTNNFNTKLSCVSKHSVIFIAIIYTRYRSHLKLGILIVIDPSIQYTDVCRGGA